jgi:hypothetical protein
LKMVRAEGTRGSAVITGALPQGLRPGDLIWHLTQA